MSRHFLTRSGWLTLAVLLTACGGGGGGSAGPSDNGSLTDDAARRAVLADLGNLLILPSLRTLETESAGLATAVLALAAAPADATARSTAQTRWRSAMLAVQRAEMLQLGPAARSAEPGGMDLRDQIYAFPLLNLCRIHNAAYADGEVDATTPIDSTGMGSLEYLLFEDVDNAACPPGSGINGQAKRAQHAARIANRIAVVASDLRDEWETSGDNFIGQFANAGAGSMVYPTPQVALDALSTAIFYAEKGTKDRKLANPTGIGATGLPACATTSCPERVESLFSGRSGTHIRANLQAFRDIFTGVSGGKGMNDLLVGIGRQDLATKIVGQIDAALSAAAALENNFEDAVADIESRQACVNAVSSRSGEPAVCALLGLVDAATDTMRAEVTAVLNLKIPDTAAGDND